MPIPQIINGVSYDFSSIQVTANRKTYINVTEINYSHGLDPGVLRGTQPMWSERGRGTYDTDGSFSMYKGDFQSLIRELAAEGEGGYMVAEFQILVMYRGPKQSKPIVDKLQRVRIKHDEDSHSSGNDIIIVKADLHIKQILRDGVSAVDVDGGGLGGLLP